MRGASALIHRVALYGVFVIIGVVGLPATGSLGNLGAREAQARTPRAATCRVPRVNPVAKLSPKKKPKKKSSAAEKDYWKNVRFGELEFREVLMQVRKQYIDARIDESRAWSQATEFFLAGAPGRDLLLVPQSFYVTRCNHPDERGVLAGRAIKLRATDRFVIVEARPAKQLKKRLSDAEIRVLRDKQRARVAALEGAWKRIRFDKATFEHVARWGKTAVGDRAWWQQRWLYAARGYLYSLDPHSSLIAKKAWDEASQAVRDSSFEGIGAVLTQRPTTDYTIVETPMEGYPAVQAGLRAGDVILAVDKKSTKGVPLQDVVTRIRGKANTAVVLTVRRDGHPNPLDISIIRKRVIVKNVSSRLLPGYKNIGYVKVTGFISSTTREVARAIDELQRKLGTTPLRGLVLDLRNNHGGLLSQAIKLADRFLERGVIVSVKSRLPADTQKFKASPGAYKFPMVVLVNDGSASASEIVASALQEHGRALVAGERTFGKASVQTLFPPILSNDYYIKLTIARYYTANDRGLQVIGVHPDVEVPRQPGDKMPLGFREEDLSNHLSAAKPYTRKNTAYTKRISGCAQRTGKAKALSKRNTAIKSDYQQSFAADMLVCMSQRR